MQQPTAVGIDPAILEQITANLDAIEQDRSVRILFAAESGSRAWGFPSPDSDYDVRFVYVHRLDHYLTITRPRDVIELPIEGDLDINGWDLQKALQLLIKPNPVLLEWLGSPILYRRDDSAYQALLHLAGKTAHLRPSQYHYLHLAKSQYNRFVVGKQEVRLKKYFYVIRPVLALIWLRCWPRRPVPMALSDLRAGLRLPAPVSSFIDQLLARKARAKELGSGPRNAALDSLIEDEIAATEKAFTAPAPVPQNLIDEADALFRQIVKTEDEKAEEERRSSAN